MVKTHGLTTPKSRSGTMPNKDQGVSQLDFLNESENKANQRGALNTIRNGKVEAYTIIQDELELKGTLPFN